MRFDPDNPNTWPENRKQHPHRDAAIEFLFQTARWLAIGGLVIGLIAGGLSLSHGHCLNENNSDHYLTAQHGSGPCWGPIYEKHGRGPHLKWKLPHLP